MNWGALAIAVLVAVGTSASLVAVPFLSGSGLPAHGPVDELAEDGPGDVELEGGVPAESREGGAPAESNEATESLRDPTGATDPSLVAMESTTPEGSVDSVSAAQQDAAERGVDEGIELVQRQGVEVTQEQRAAAIDAAVESVSQHQEADVEQVQKATAGAVHGALIQNQRVNASQVQAVVGGATDGTLSQHQSVNATQMQHAAWGATHGAIAQRQTAAIEGLQVTTRGAAAGAAFEAGEKDVGEPAKIQEAAQGAAFGVIEQYQTITVEQRQRVTLDHVQHAAAGGAAGALDGATIEQVQRVEVEQYQRVTIKQVQAAAMGGAKGALDQRQEVTVEQTQAAARGGAKGACERIAVSRPADRVDVVQFQSVSITQIQEAAYGGSKGAIVQSQEATIEQIQSAATGATKGAIVQSQRATVVQTQSAATGAAIGAVESAVQREIVDVEGIQAAARGASEGAVTQVQIVNVVQVQVLARGSASGALSQHQRASVEQLQTSARAAGEATAERTQSQRVSVAQLQRLSETTAAGTAEYAAETGTTDEQELEERADEGSNEAFESVEELEGTATIDLDEQVSDGETIVVDSVSLSEGGFVAVYDETRRAGDVSEPIGVSAFLERGDHEDVEIALEEGVTENRTLIAVPHLDTDGDETFGFAETGGEEDVEYVAEGGGPVTDVATVTIDDGDEAEPGDEDDGETEPEASLSVADQEGDGTNVAVEEATASVEFFVRAEHEDEIVESEGFDANETAENLALEFEQPIEENDSVEVSVVDTDGDPIETETIEYAVVDEPDEPTAELSVDDQEGDGTNVTVAEATASVDYYLEVEYGDEAASTDTFEGEDRVENETIALDPPIEENRTLSVTVRAAEGDAELASEEIEYEVLPDEPDEEPDERPTAEIAFEDRESFGANATVDEVSLSDGGFVAIHQAESIDEIGPETVVGVSEFLEPGEYEDVDAALFGEIAGADFDREVLADGEVDLIAVVHLDETDEEGVADDEGNETFDYVETDGEVDAPYVDENDDPIGDEATVTVVTEYEFVQCDRVEVTGAFGAGEGLFANAFFYATEGPESSEPAQGVTFGEDVDSPFVGTVVFQVGDDPGVEEVGDDELLVEVPNEGDFGGSIVANVSTLSDGDEVDRAERPDLAECRDEIRPERPEIGVESATPIDGGAEVTFAYENPNDAPILVSSAFLEGTTADEPPTELDPGEGEFTVEWTPETDEERLVWGIDLSTYGDDETLTAETPPAQEVLSEPAAFDVEIVDTNDPVAQGEVLEVEVTIENGGDEDGSEVVTASLDGAEESVRAELGGGQQAVAVFSFSTGTLAPGEYAIGVTTESGDADETTVVVTGADGGDGDGADGGDGDGADGGDGNSGDGGDGPPDDGGPPDDD